MKILPYIITCLFVFNFSFSQEKYFTTNGFVNFFSHSPIEDINADNNQTMSVVNIENSEIVIHVLMKSFMFEKSLMQEHFNENYVESDKYPKSKFNGKILNFDSQNSSEQKVTVKGELSLHGKTRPVETEATILYKDKKLSLKGTFNVLVADYDIRIPRTVINNIAKSIKVSFDIDHEPYTK